MIRTHRDTGDGDRCPQDPAHGHMFFVHPARQWCPNARHTGSSVYLRDGVTPAQQGESDGTPSRRARPGASVPDGAPTTASGWN